VSEVPIVATPTDELSYAAILRDTHTAVFGDPPSPLCLACAWAQIALENAHGRALFCFNYGNLMASKAWSGDYYVLRTKERVSRDPDVWKEFDSHFRAFDDHLEGASSYWNVMTYQFSPVLALFELGRPSEAAYKLSEMGYYTARANIYAATMTSLFHTAQAHILPIL